jgi:hypothetical protein
MAKTSAKKITKSRAKLKPVIVRCRSASPHFGYLKTKSGSEVTLEKARRIWRWFGAWTLSEVASKGLDTSKSKIAAPTSVTLSDWIEIIDCTPEAVKSIESATWAA